MSVLLVRVGHQQRRQASLRQVHFLAFNILIRICNRAPISLGRIGPQMEKNARYFRWCGTQHDVCFSVYLRTLSHFAFRSSVFRPADFTLVSRVAGRDLGFSPAIFWSFTVVAGSSIPRARSVGAVCSIRIEHFEAFFILYSI